MTPSRLPAGLAGLLVTVLVVGCAPDDAPRAAGSGPTQREPGAGRTGLQRLEVVRHTDGDTLRAVLREDGPAGPAGAEVSVRLLEIDAPESVDPRRPDQCFGAEAAGALARMLPVGARGWGEVDREVLDPYGRTLLYLYADRRGSRVMVNLELVRGGYAKAVLYEPNDRHIKRMRAAEQQARQAGRGLWGACPVSGA